MTNCELRMVARAPVPAAQKLCCSTALLINFLGRGPRYAPFIALASILIAIPAARGEPTTIDDFDDLAAWTVIASDGVEARISPAEHEAGRAMRLDFDFKRGGGFCVVRRSLDLPLPENYRFTFALRGDAPANNLEFKLVDPSGRNVWWVNQRKLTFPTEWQTVAYKARHFRFAWGPAGDKPLSRLGAIEFAVAAGTGGKGTIWFDTLTIEKLPPPQPLTETPLVECSSGAAKPLPLVEDKPLNWRSEDADTTPWLHLDFRQWRAFGGLTIEWDPADFARDYDVLLSEDGVSWQPAESMRGSNGGRDYIPLPDAEARHLRICTLATCRNKGAGVKRIRIEPLEFGDSPNAMFKTIAADAPKGWYPRYFLDKQTPWTVIGALDGTREALLDVCGAVEVDKGGFRIEPFLYVDNKLITWADVQLDQRLRGDRVPVPAVTWKGAGLELSVAALVDPSSRLRMVYELYNTAKQRQSVSLFLAIRPFQVLPPWQDLNITGGVSPIRTVAGERAQLVVNNRKLNFTGPIAPEPLGATGPTGATAFVSGSIVEYLAAGRLPPAQSVNDDRGLASAAIRFDFNLESDQKVGAVLWTWTQDNSDDLQQLHVDRSEAKTIESKKRQSRMKMDLPASASRIVKTLKSTQAYILINADGPAIQPGSRTYERSWIRDGALTSTALLVTGHFDRVRDFLDWYAPHQYENGKIPCIVDARGPDPVPEHDSTGQFIYALLKYYRFTQDKPFLERHWPRVVAAVGYIESLRNQRMTDEYKNGPPLKRACYGLVPESISHEGYSARPMHSYWDDFFVLKGLKDATTIAEILGHEPEAARFAALRDAFRTSLYDSMRLVMKTHNIDYIPGCVELGDFDATSTAVAAFPCNELGLVPEPALTNTFERYYKFFKQRRDGAIEWESYTPYEVRLIGTFVRLGQPERAHELIDFFMRHQRPAGWYQWAEVVWRDPDTPRFVGDMPHTWVGSDFINAIRSLFVYERERDDALVVAAGVPYEWAAACSTESQRNGVVVDGFPTEYGSLAYVLSAERNRVSFTLRNKLDRFPTRFVLHSPGQGPIQAVEVDGRPHADFTARTVTLAQPFTRVVIQHGN